MDIRVIASGSDGNAIIINDGTTSLLLDAGITFRELQKATKYRLSDISGCLITHEHSDHSKACADLAKRGINLYSGYGTFKSIGLSGHRCNELVSLKAFDVGSFTVLPFDVIHDAYEPFGFLIESKTTKEKLVYFSDTAYIKYSFSGLTHIIAECNHGDRELVQSVNSGIIDHVLAQRIAKNHMSVERLVRFLEKSDISRLQEIHLIHLSDNNSNEARFKKLVEQVTGLTAQIH